MNDSDKTDLFYSEALLRLALQWSAGDISGIVTDSEEATICINHLKQHIAERKHSLEGITDTERNTKIDDAYDDIIRCHVINHYVTTASHRRWVRLIYRLMSMAGVLDADKELDEATKKHDLSKYSTKEAVGYGIMFGKTGSFRSLEGSEKVRWETALESHLHTNSHHPQYFGERCMDQVSLEESLIDMLACRIERQMAGEKNVEPAQLMDIDSKFLHRYTDKDRESVQKLILKWQKGLDKFVDGDCVDQDTMAAARQWEADSGRKLFQ